MTIRLKITLLITAAGFIASLVFSSIVLLEMTEQPFRLIDADLRSAGLRVAQAVASNASMSPAPRLTDDDFYWIEVKGQTPDKLLYRSHLARQLQIAAPPVGRAVTVSTIVPSQVSIGEEPSKEVAFRLQTFIFPIAGSLYRVTSGRPVEHLKEELEDTVISVASGLAFSVLLLAGISYFLAGFMLRPIREINMQAREISEKHLDRRMPISENNDEFTNLAQTLNRVFDRLQQAFFRQKRLLADASHELKTPLTMIRLALDEIRSETDEVSPDPYSESHARITEQVLRMDRLVKGLLDLSALEIEATTIKEAVDLTPVLRSLIDDYVFLADARSIIIYVDLPEQLQLQGDAEKLTRAFSNLLDNAIKYNNDGGSISIKGIQSNSILTISLANTGIGVPKADIPRIFEQFYRVEKSRSLRHGGTGLGLAIVKRVVELHGGTVTLESMPEGLTTVTVTLPRFDTPFLKVPRPD